MLGSTLNKELARRKLSDQVHDMERDLDAADMSLRSIFHASKLEDGEFRQCKYVKYRLLRISPEEDADLYRIMSILMNDVYWYPTSYQESVEEGVFSDIMREMELFLEEEPNDFDVASGEILLHFAELLSNDADIPLATACELLLSNCDIPLDETDEDRIISKYHNAILCDQVECFRERLFIGPDVESFVNDGLSYWYNGLPVMPTWNEQYQTYLENLMEGKPEE